MYFFSLLYCSMSNKLQVQTRLLLSVSIRFFIFHHFSQKPLKNCVTMPLMFYLLFLRYIGGVNCNSQHAQHKCGSSWQSQARQVKPKTIKFVFAAFLLGMQYSRARAKTGFLRIRFMCPSEATCLLKDCCFSELALSRSN